jgi:hypothetical protein
MGLMCGEDIDQSSLSKGQEGQASVPPGPLRDSTDTTTNALARPAPEIRDNTESEALWQVGTSITSTPTALHFSKMSQSNGSENPRQERDTKTSVKD